MSQDEDGNKKGLIVRRNPFGRRVITLDQMSHAEWEALCDRCGRCCLHKLGSSDRAREVYYTNVACRLLDPYTCQCTAYAERFQQVPDCMAFTPESVDQAWWLPGSCAYRRLAQGVPLEPWHPLLTGDPESVHRAGISVRGKTVPEREVKEEDLPDYIIEWIDG